MTSLLAHYEEVAATKSSHELRHALKDIKETLDIWKDADPTEGYAAKLWAEWDAYTVEYQKRQAVLH